MDFTIDKQELAAAIERCLLAVPDERHPTPAFQMMLVDATKKKKSVRLAAVGEACSVDTVADAEVKTAGKFVVRPKRLMDVVSAMPEGKIRLSLTGTRVTAKALVGSRRASFESSAIDVQPVEDPGEGAPWVELDSRVLVRDLGLVKQASSWEDRKDLIDLVMLLPSERGLDLFAFNGKRMAVIQSKLRLDGQPITLPGTAIGVLALMAQRDDFVRLFADERRVYLENRDTLVSAAMPVGHPTVSNYSTLLGHLQDSTGAQGPTFKVKPFGESVKSLLRLWSFASSEEKRVAAHTIRVLFGETIKLDLGISEADAQDEIAVDQAGADIDAYLPARQLEQMLTSFANSEVVQVSQVDTTLIFRSQGVACAIAQLVKQ